MDQPEPEPEPVPNCLQCGNSFDSEQFMIQCEICQMWYHGPCVQLKEYIATELDEFHCPLCQEKHGPSTMKVRMNWHRHDYTEIGADSKPVQTGTPVFIRELKSRHFPRPDEIIKQLKGQQLTMQYLQTNGFDSPIIVDIKEGLDIVVPSQNFSIQDVANYIGHDREMDVIDVARQNNIRLSMREFVEYYNDPCRSRILNVISLEFTSTGLSPLVEAPYIARKLDWVNYVWPRDLPEDSQLKKPEVQKYCLMSVKDSFTDFHIDFGGTSVWYHVLRGEKVFYLIKPTPANLHLYQQWMCSSTQSETFFGDQVDACYKCVVKQGQTMLIPTGWIHAVLTPVDSLVFGGNFVHSLNIPMQIQIYEMEKKMKTPTKFQYPSFETIHWFAAKRLLKELKDLNIEEKKCPPYLLQGLKALLSILKQWNTDKDYNMLSRAQIPAMINSQKLLKDLSKEVRHAERFLIALNPPKPERESKRKKKKPVNKDFVDFKGPESSKTKSLNKELLLKKEAAIVKQAPNIPPLKLTLPKPIVHSSENVSQASKQQQPSVQKPVKTIKTLSPKVPAAKKSTKSSSTIKNSASRTSNVNKSPNKKQPAVKRIPGETKSILKNSKQNPSVIRFKLGDKEVVRSTKDKGNDEYGNFTLDHAVETRKELTWKQTTSVYDFHDGSNESDYGGFTIDEAPKKRKVIKSSNSPKKIKKCEPLIEASSVPKNGIEELLKASAYTLAAGTPRLDPVIPSVNDSNFVQQAPISTGASPSTRDAIAGMLSFSAQCYSNTPEIPVKQIKVLKPKPIVVEHEDEDDILIENMDKVHQDDDFIYPALDVSDDDEFMFKPKSKREEDEAWNPKARVGPLLPKTNRPPRDGAKKISVEKGLEAAAKKRSKPQGPSKRTYKKKKKESPTSTNMTTSVVTESTVTALPSESLADTSAALITSTVSTSIDLQENVSKQSTYISILTSPNRLKDVKAKLAAPIPVERKPKKGLKTAKQRLGKILKIHRMWH